MIINLDEGSAGGGGGGGGKRERSSNKSSKEKRDKSYDDIEVRKDKRVSRKRNL